MRFSSDDTAKRVTAELTRVMSLAAKDRSSSGPVQDLAKKLKFNLDGSATKISLRLTERDLERSAEAFRAGYKASLEAENTGTASAPPPAHTAPPTPVSLKPAVIRIEGLDEGPREIPYPEPQQ